MPPPHGPPRRPQAQARSAASRAMSWRAPRRELQPGLGDRRLCARNDLCVGSVLGVFDGAVALVVLGLREEMRMPADHARRLELARCVECLHEACKIMGETMHGR